MTSKKSRRKNYLIDRKFQLNFTFRFLLIIIIFVLLTGFSIIMVYYIKYQSGKSFFDNYLVIVKEGEAIEITNMFIITAPVIIISSLIIALFIFIYGILYSHKIAGPIYRVRKTLESINKGFLDFKVKLRKKDKFRDLEEHLNNVINTFSNEFSMLKRYNTDLLAKIKEIQTVLSKSPFDREKANNLLNEIKKVNLNMDTSFNKFKTKTDDI